MCVGSEDRLVMFCNEMTGRLEQLFVCLYRLL